MSRPLLLPARAATPMDRLLPRLSRWLRNRRTRRALGRLEDFRLDDIGLSRLDARAETRRWFWQG